MHGALAGCSNRLNHNRPMLARLLAFVTWALLACISVFWLLRLLDAPLPLPAGALPAADGAVARADLGRLLGNAAAPAVAEAPAASDGRYKLLGLVAPNPARGVDGNRHAGEGVALISVDGAPPRPVRVGGAVDGDLRLLALERRSVSLGAAGVERVRLNLEAPVPAATGSLPLAQPMPLPGQPPQQQQPLAPQPLPALPHPGEPPVPRPGGDAPIR